MQAIFYSSSILMKRLLNLFPCLRCWLLSVTLAWSCHSILVAFHAAIILTACSYFTRAWAFLQEAESWSYARSDQVFELHACDSDSDSRWWKDQSESYDQKCDVFQQLGQTLKDGDQFEAVFVTTRDRKEKRKARIPTNDVLFTNPKKEYLALWKSTASL
jgi:hypothetical protein